jgi:hypothetical protein
MDNRVGDELYLSYEGVPRPEWLTHPLIDLRNAEFLDRGTNLFPKGEPIRMRLAWSNFEDLPKTSLRIEIYSSDDIAQGTFVLFDLYQGFEGEFAELEVEVPTDRLAPAAYYMKYTFFQRDEFGNNENMECRRGLAFEIVSNDTEEPLVWDTFNWGYVHLAGAKILSLNEETATPVL